jgi:hypothetical protein
MRTRGFDRPVLRASACIRLHFCGNVGDPGAEHSSAARWRDRICHTLGRTWSREIVTEIGSLLIAQDLSARYTMQQLAHLKGPELHELLVAALKKISATTLGGGR